MTSANNLYYEEIRLSAIGRLALGMLVLALVFVALVFFDPFAVSNKGDSQSGIFWVPASLFFGLAWFAGFMGKFTIIATDKRLIISAGMNSNSISWSEIASAGEDYSRRPPCNVLTAVPSVQGGESVMVYAIGRLPRIELTLKSEPLRRIVFPTRQPDVLLKLIQEKARQARGIPITIEKDDLEMVSANVFDIPDPFGQIGGPPPFPLP